MRSLTTQERVMKPQECLLGRLSKLPSKSHITILFFLSLYLLNESTVTIVAMVRDSAMTSLISFRFFTELSINSYSNQVFFP